MTPVPATLPIAGPRRTRRELLRRLGAHRFRLGAALGTLLAGTAVTLATPPSSAPSSTRSPKAPGPAG